MTLAARLHEEITASLKGAEVEVMSEDDVHFYVSVDYASFKGLPLLKQHKMVYDALSTELKGEVHALSLHTSSRQDGVPS